MNSIRPIHTANGTLDCSEIKRCHVHGAVVKVYCPKCHKPCEWDLSIDHIEFPEHNIWMDGFQLLCQECGHCWNVDVRFNATATVEVRGPEQTPIKLEPPKPKMKPNIKVAPPVNNLFHK